MFSMTLQEINLKGEIASYYKTTQEGKAKAHFFPGNGMPVGVYSPLLQLLSEEYDISSLAFRGSWKDALKRNQQVKWRIYAKDLIHFVETYYNAPIVGIAHSQGANATIIAAAQRPDLFKEIYVIDPVCVTTLDELWLGCVPYFVKKNFEPFKSSLKKKDQWESIEEYFNFLKNAKGYKRISTQNLQIFAKESLKKAANGKHELIFPKDWETANYALPINITKELKSLKVPYKIILGKPSLFVNDTVRKKWMTFAQDKIVVNSKYGHLIPLEAPEFCFGQIVRK